MGHLIGSSRKTLLRSAASALVVGWFLAEMAGQGNYFVLQHHDYGTQEACERIADKLNGELFMYRYICVKVNTQ